MTNQSKKYLATTEQLNVLLSTVSEMKIKEGMGAYQVIQQILRQPYNPPTPEAPKTEEVEVAEEAPKEITEKKPKRKYTKKKKSEE